ncbi:hypothetical protein E2C01_026817 [Portunus trituberculatus]|uniref:Uncharacterized protein n=1 Tax=Portunus trituberculatus TaxID=210409 RepID=A0A5B7EJP2_PORTR|nr:hypothetical protein [Portunus trituberculatus]
MFCLHPRHEARPLLAYSALNGSSSSIGKTVPAARFLEFSKTLADKRKQPLSRGAMRAVMWRPLGTRVTNHCFYNIHEEL